METFLKAFELDIAGIFSVSTSVPEIFVRGTIMYIFIFVLLRIVIKREIGSVGISDLLVVVLIADAASNAMAGEYKSITEGALLVGTIVFWSYAFDWLGFRYSWFRRILHPDPLCLVKEGRILRPNLKRELITEEELMSQIRLQGIMDIKEVKEALMEGDGRISVVPYEEGKGA